jgi:hypothetical protein
LRARPWPAIVERTRKRGKTGFDARRLEPKGSTSTFCQVQCAGRSTRDARLDSSTVAKSWRIDEDHGRRHSRRAASPRARHCRGRTFEYQQKIIKNYYENREAISLQRLSELVTELYLAEGKARARQWKNIRAALEKLKVPADRIEHLVKQDNPTLVARLVEELLAKK